MAEKTNVYYDSYRNNLHVRFNNRTYLARDIPLNILQVIESFYATATSTLNIYKGYLLSIAYENSKLHLAVRLSCVVSLIEKKEEKSEFFEKMIAAEVDLL